MDQMATLEVAIGELHREVAALNDLELDTLTNCEPWTVRQLASHALNNQLVCAGLVTGQETVTVEDTMGAVPYDGDLATYADEVAERSLAPWGTPGVLTAVHATPFGELPGRWSSTPRRSTRCATPGTCRRAGVAPSSSHQSGSRRSRPWSRRPAPTPSGSSA